MYMFTKLRLRKCGTKVPARNKILRLKATWIKNNLKKTCFSLCEIEL